MGLVVEQGRPGGDRQLDASRWDRGDPAGWGGGEIEEPAFSGEEVNGRVADGVVGVRDDPAVPAVDGLRETEIGTAVQVHHPGVGEDVVDQGVDAGPGGTTGKLGGDGGDDVRPGEGARLSRQAGGPGEVVDDRLAASLVRHGWAGGGVEQEGDGAGIVPGLGRLGSPPLVEARGGLAVVLGLAGGQGGGLGGMGAAVAVGGQLGPDLHAAAGEQGDQTGVDPRQISLPLGTDRPPFHPKPIGQIMPQHRLVEGARGQTLSVQATGVQGGPPAIDPLDGVGDQDVGVELRVSVAGRPVPERRAHQPAAVDLLRAVPAPSSVSGVDVKVGQGCGHGRLVRTHDLKAGGGVTEGPEQAHPFGG